MNGNTEKPSSMNRRQFLLTTCGATLAMVVHHGLAGVGGVQAAEQFVEPSCGQHGKTAKAVLIAYASRCGSTGGVAQAMAEVLCAQGASVDVRLVDKVKDLGQYQAVMVGSAIRMGKWLSEANAFVKNHQETLGRLAVAYFTVCLTMRQDTPENRAKVLAYLDPVRKNAPRVNPVAVGLFPGVVDFSKLSFAQKSILEAKGVVEGDYRNWPAVKGWASEVGPGLLAAGPRG